MSDVNSFVKKEYQRRTTSGGSGGSERYSTSSTTEYGPDGSYRIYSDVSGQRRLIEEGFGDKVTYSATDQYSREGNYTGKGGKIGANRRGGDRTQSQNTSKDSSAYFPSYQSRNLSPSGGLRVLAEGQRRGFYGDKKVASSAGPMPGRMQPVVTAMHERNRVEYGGGMGGELRPESAMALGFGRLFEREARKQGGGYTPGVMTSEAGRYETSSGRPVYEEQSAFVNEGITTTPISSTTVNNPFQNQETKVAGGMLAAPTQAGEYEYKARIGWGGAFEQQRVTYPGSQTPKTSSERSILEPGWQGELAFYSWAGALGGAVVGGPVGAVIGAGGGAVGYGAGKASKYVASEVATKAEPFYAGLPESAKMGYKAATLPFQISYEALRATIAPDMTPSGFVGGVAELGGFVVASSAAAGKLAGYAESKFIGSSRVVTKGIGEQRVTPMGDYTVMGYEASGKGVSGSRLLPKNKFLYEARGVQLGRTVSPNKLEAADVSTVIVGGKTPLGSTYIKSVRVAGQYSGETAEAKTIRYTRLGTYDKGNLIGIDNTVKVPESTVVAGRSRSYDIVKPGVYRPRGTNTVGAVTYSKTDRLVGDVDYTKTLTYQRTDTGGLIRGRRTSVSRSDWAVAEQPAAKMPKGGGFRVMGGTVQKTRMAPASTAVSDVSVKQGVKIALREASLTVPAQTTVRFGRVAAQSAVVSSGLRKASRQSMVVVSSQMRKKASSVSTMTGLRVSRGGRQGMVSVSKSKSAQTLFTPSVSSTRSMAQSSGTVLAQTTTQSTASSRSGGLMDVVLSPESSATPVMPSYKAPTISNPKGFGIVPWGGRRGPSMGGRGRFGGRWTRAYIAEGADVLGYGGGGRKRGGGKKSRRRRR